jgi:hypothetical protein
MRSKRGVRLLLLYTVAAFAALLGGWNVFAGRFSGAAAGLERHGAVFENAALDLRRTLAELPAPARPRIAVFGSSQIATVKGDPDPVGLSVPYRLQQQLAEQGLAAEVVDLSEGGQQLVESMVLQLASLRVVQANLVVIGVSLFSMQTTQIRETLLEAIEAAALRDLVRAELPPGLDPETTRSLTAFSRQAKQRLSSRGETIQQRLDARIANWLAAHLAAFANRQVMFDELIDAPIRRDLAELIKRNLAEAKTARTFQIGNAYPVSLAALEVMGRACHERGIPLLVVVLPYDDSRPPVPFEPDTQRRIVADLQAAAQRRGFELLDASRLLGPEHFAFFEDRSPDDLHFDRAGHALLGGRIAERVAPWLAAAAQRAPDAL